MLLLWRQNRKLLLALFRRLSGHLASRRHVINQSRWGLCDPLKHLYFVLFRLHLPAERGYNGHLGRCGISLTLSIAGHLIHVNIGKVGGGVLRGRSYIGVFLNLGGGNGRISGSCSQFFVARGLLG